MSLEDFMIYNSLEDAREDEELEEDEERDDDEVCGYEERKEACNSNDRGDGKSESRTAIWSRIRETLNGDGLIGCLWSFGQVILIMLSIMFLTKACDNWIEGHY